MHCGASVSEVSVVSLNYTIIARLYVGLKKKRRRKLLFELYHTSITYFRLADHVFSVRPQYIFNGNLSSPELLRHIHMYN